MKKTHNNFWILIYFFKFQQKNCFMLLLCITANHLIFQIQNQHHLHDSFFDFFFLLEDATPEKVIKKYNSELSEEREKKT